MLLRWLHQKKVLFVPKLSRVQLGCLVTAAIVILGPFIFNRLQSIGQTFDQRGGLNYRISHIILTADLLTKRPLGLGLNTFQYIVLDAYDAVVYFHDSTPAHNLLAEVAGGFGILGFGVFLILIFVMAKEMWRYVKLLKKSKIKSELLVVALLFLVLNYFLFSQFYPWLFSPVISGIVWMFLGFIYAKIPAAKV
jgi:O-antigen ligase